MCDLFHLEQLLSPGLCESMLNSDSDPTSCFIGLTGLMVVELL